MSSGIFCRKCHGVYGAKKTYREHKCGSFVEVAQNSIPNDKQNVKCHFCLDLVNSYPLYRWCPFCGKYLDTSSIS